MSNRRKVIDVSPMSARCKSGVVVGCALGDSLEARGLTPTSRGAAPTGLDQLSMLTQRLRAGLSHVAASRLECGAFGRPRDLESGGCGRRADCSNWSGIGGGRTDCPNWSAIGVGGRTPRTECGRGMDGRRRRIGDSVGSWRADSRLNVVVGS